MVWDFTCRDTLSPSHVISTTKEAGKASEQAETTKMSTYNNLNPYAIMLMHNPSGNGNLGFMGPH